MTFYATGVAVEVEEYRKLEGIVPLGVSRGLPVEPKPDLPLNRAPLIAFMVHPTILELSLFAPGGLPSFDPEEGKGGGIIEHGGE